MSEERIQYLPQRALQAFERDLPKLWIERPGEWVAYHWEQQLGFARHKHELCQECFGRGWKREDYVIFCIEPQETEMWTSGVSPCP